MKVFISYPSERQKIAREVYEFLKSVDMEVWFDSEILVAGQDWDRERSQAQKEADLTVLICSPETINKAGVIQREIKDILEHLRDKPLGQIYLVAVRTEDIRLPPEIAKYHYISHFQPNWKLQLGRSLELKCKQAGVLIPHKLDQFFQTSQSPESYTIKSLKESNDVLDLDSEYFTYNLEADYWSYINSTIISEVMGGLYGAKATFTETVDFAELKNQWSIRVEEFFRIGEVISLRFFTSWYGSGAAHPNMGIYTMNFGGSNYGKFDLGQLFDHNSEAIRFLIRYCKLDLQRQLLAYDDSLEFLSYPETDQQAWDVFSQFSFDGTGLSINFSPYDVLAYVYGPQVVQVPWEMIRDKVSVKLLAGPLGDVVGRTA